MTPDATLSPEATLLCVNAVLLGFAYLWVYPGLPRKTARRILRYDVAITLASLLVAGLLFAGQGLRFEMLLFNAPWWVFSVLTMAVMEFPVWEWFRRRHGITFDDWGDD